MLPNYLSEAGNSAPPLSIVRHATQHTVLQNPRSVSPRSGIWKIVAGMAAAGVLFGFGAAGWYRSNVLAAQKVQRWERTSGSKDQGTRPPLVIVPSASGNQVNSGTLVDPVEVERLKTRNRRLEALVQVLQKRSQVERSSGIAAHH